MVRRGALVIVVLLVPSILVPRGAAGQTECAAGKVAFVQGPVILASIARYAAKDAEVTFNVNQYTIDMTRQQALLDSLAGAYRDKSALLPASGALIERQKLEEQSAQIQLHLRDLQQQLGQVRQRLLQPIEIGVQAVIDSVRADLKCGVIFDISSGAVIASFNKALDLTQRVIDRIKATGDTALFGPRPPSRGNRKPSQTSLLS